MPSNAVCPMLSAFSIGLIFNAIGIADAVTSKAGSVIFFQIRPLNSSRRTTTLLRVGCYLLNVDAVMLDGWMFGWSVRWGNAPFFLLLLLFLMLLWMYSCYYCYCCQELSLKTGRIFFLYLSCTALVLTRHCLISMT